MISTGPNALKWSSVKHLPRARHLIRIELYKAHLLHSGSAPPQYAACSSWLWYNGGEQADSIDVRLKVMAKRFKDIKEIKIERPPRAKLSEKEVLKRMEDFPKRKEKFIATIRAGKN